MSKIIVIGSGFSGLSSASYLSAAGHEVHIYEKNAQPGGRARQLKENGYVFDMGPSWYWMPDVFEKFFSDFGYKVSDFYSLKLLNPSFDIVFPDSEIMSVPEKYAELSIMFESIEKGSSLKLDKFMQEAQFKYNTGMGSLVYKPGLSLMEFADLDLMKGTFRLQVFSSFRKHVRKFFSDPRLIALMEFPVLFLGAMPQDTPALYSLMNYAGLKLGTWYPDGGFGKVIDAFLEVAKRNGSNIHLDSPVEKIIVENNKATGIMVNGKRINCDAIIASADYHHVESILLDQKYRNYDETYWKKKVFAPSCLIFYIGLNKKINKLSHHTLFFDEDLEQHAIEIYKEPKWPSKPLFYVCCPSKTDDNIAPEDHENLFFLMPLAPGLTDTEELREKYFNHMITRFNKHIQEDISKAITYKKSYCVSDFKTDYHAYKGNAYGLANTLLQTANLKPSIRNKVVKNLFYTGQLTVPGPGVPPSIISGKVAAGQLIKHLTSLR
ncbi:MAG: phytoene desaturase family protein [Daejeonella sp.]|uniref:phytoene desaturase family protein n=1 Tax=Daejeonella sp. TaxID=2805397 RepID=UPI0027375AE2|nr:phytoene desaturase family protein [Daejeonella sp.]MDP3468197.1 phytoene desaturase family protein [Daejeonella sp.]